MLTPSQRVTLLKEISQRLGAEDWALVDVTLRQFDLPTSDQWSSGDRAGYVIDKTEKASDSVLIELGQHVGFNLEDLTPVHVEPAFWRPGMFRIFLSHLAVHKDQATRLQAEFLDFGITAFVAHSDIEPTLEWQIQIETALATAHSLVALLHPNFHLSNWTDQEIGYAMGRGIPVFAVRWGQDPYGFIGRFQAFNAGTKTPRDLANELFDAYRKDKRTQPRIASSLVKLFEESNTFAESKRRIGYLEQLEKWEPGFAARIKAAAKSNSQIYGSWGVPERVDALAQKWFN